MDEETGKIIPFKEEFYNLIEDRVFQRTLILWLHYIKNQKPSDIFEFKGYNSQRIYDVKG